MIRFTINRHRTCITSITNFMNLMQRLSQYLKMFNKSKKEQTSFCLIEVLFIQLQEVRLMI